MAGSLLQNTLRGSKNNSWRLPLACMPGTLQWQEIRLLVPVPFPYRVNQMLHYLLWVREMSWFQWPRMDSHLERTAERFMCKNNWVRGGTGRQIPSTCLLCCLRHLLTPLSTVVNGGHGPVLLRGWGRVLARWVVIYGHLGKKGKNSREWQLQIK